VNDDTLTPRERAEQIIPPPSPAMKEIIQARSADGTPLTLVNDDNVTLTDEEATLLELDETLTTQNLTMFTQLGIINQSPGPLLLIQVQIQTLIDLLVDDEDAHRKFEIACQLRLNGELKARLGRATQGLQVPGGEG
jgi:hypothetical protein